MGSSSGVDPVSLGCIGGVDPIPLKSEIVCELLITDIDPVAVGVDPEAVCSLDHLDPVANSDRDLDLPVRDLAV